MSAQLTAHLGAAESPAVMLDRWRTAHPDWLSHRYRLIDESYNGLTWEWRHTPAAMRFVPFAKVFGGQTVYRLTALFQDDGEGGSKITVNGSCDQDTHDALRAITPQVQEGGTP